MRQRYTLPSLHLCFSLFCAIDTSLVLLLLDSRRSLVLASKVVGLKSITRAKKCLKLFEREQCTSANLTISLTVACAHCFILCTASERPHRCRWRHTTNDMLQLPRVRRDDSGWGCPGCHQARKRRERGVRANECRWRLPCPGASSKQYHGNTLLLLWMY